MHIWYAPTHPRTHALIPVLDHQDPFQPFHNDTFGYYYIWLYKLLSQHHLLQHLDYIMNATDYWPPAIFNIEHCSSCIIILDSRS